MKTTLKKSYRIVGVISVVVDVYVIVICYPFNPCKKDGMFYFVWRKITIQILSLHTFISAMIALANGLPQQQPQLRQRQRDGRQSSINYGAPGRHILIFKKLVLIKLTFFYIKNLICFKLRNFKFINRNLRNIHMRTVSWSAQEPALIDGRAVGPFALQISSFKSIPNII